MADLMEYKKLDNFSIIASADLRRIEFNTKNEQVVSERNRPDLLFIGDSITQCFELGAYFKGCFYINRGIGGDKVEFIKRRIYADAIALRPKKIIFFAGINDILTIVGDVWYKTEGRNPDTVIKELSDNLFEIARLCKKENSDILFCSILPVTLSEVYKGSLVDETILKVNEIIKEICSEFGFIYVDYYNAFKVGNTVKGLSSDGLHPNAEGYKIMAEIIKKIIG